MTHPPTRTYPITRITRVDSDKSNKMPHRDLFWPERVSPSHTGRSRISKADRVEQSRVTLASRESDEGKIGLERTWSQGK